MRRGCEKNEVDRTWNAEIRRVEFLAVGDDGGGDDDDGGGDGDDGGGGDGDDGGDDDDDGDDDGDGH